MEREVTGRLGIDNVLPDTTTGKYPAKAVVGEAFPVSAVVWREGLGELWVLLEMVALGSEKFGEPVCFVIAWLAGQAKAKCAADAQRVVGG
mgnify:CR=1 FL=1